MSAWPSQKIRQTFLDFFEAKQHTIVSSAPLVLKDDPTLLFTNAGMNPFKSYFLGQKKPKNHKVTNTQKCLRVSGKHNDLEEVGLDTYHHTFFEMLGNWSFGDVAAPKAGYFKKEAIDWAWELLTAHFNIDKSKLYVTIFEGDKEDNLARDDEAYQFWKQHIDESRILNGSKEDNFWEMGETGPSGPCSEIHVDIRPDEERKKIDGSQLVNKDHPLVIELWNLVFIQYNRKANGTLELLPAKHIDTGMGFERLCTVLQGKQSNYDTDLFFPLIKKVEKHCGKPYGKNNEVDIAMRAIADHFRAVAFSIVDGQLPSNTGAGYVIRRILRRAVRYAYSFLDIKEPFLNQLISVIAKQFEHVFPELKAQQQFVKKVIEEEERNFLKTLAKGLKRIEQYGENITGEQAFELYDTYGFPIDLTRLIASEKKILVDENGFQKAMQEQRNRSKQAASNQISDWIVLKEEPNSLFVGYEILEVKTTIQKYRETQQKGKKRYELVLAQTPFYPESGGQIGDTGLLFTADDKITIIDTRKENNEIIHVVTKLLPDLTKAVTARVDDEKRRLTQGNHSATHLLHAALRKVLGNHVEQKGSFVAPEKLRFDFSHFTKVTDEELAKIEQIVNKKIANNITKGEERNVPFEKAMERGITALFGEKYEDEVRVITFDSEFSAELCGGTHVNSTAEIGWFKLVHESAIAAGIRRIEAVTGSTALKYFQNEEATITKLKEVLKTQNLLQGVENMMAENKALKERLEHLTALQVKEVKKRIKENVKKIDGINLVTTKVELVDAAAIKDLAFQLKNETEDLLLVLGAEVKGKPQITVVVSDSLVEKRNWHAGKIVKELSTHIKGGGGGQPFYATAGGSYLQGLDAAITAAENIFNSKN